MKLKISIFLFLGMLFCISCQNETETLDPIDQGYEFAPVEMGKYWIYSSDSIIYRQGGQIIDSLSGFIKEEIVDTFRDEEQLLNYKIQRFFKRDEADVWEETDLWFSSKSETNYTRIEENLKFISLIFPVKEGVTWDGNAFFDENIQVFDDGEPLQPYKNWEYDYCDIDTSYNNGSLSLDNVLLVKHVDDDIVIEKRVSTEMYAKEVGLVQKKISILYCQQCAGNGDPIEDNAEVGYRSVLNLIDYN